MRPFSINIRGRVKNFNLPKNQPLVPLFEAIVNAIHAIGERKSTDPSFEGQIIIRILRDGQFVLDGTGELPQIQSFEIIDNGIGFNEANIASFMESDSTYKAQIGGKGVGRFSWLIAFEKAEIESVYSEEDEYVKRSFDFSISNSGINDMIIAGQLMVNSMVSLKSPLSDLGTKRVSKRRNHGTKTGSENSKDLSARDEGID